MQKKIKDIQENKKKKPETTTIEVFKKDIDKLVSLKQYPFEGLAWVVKRLVKDNTHKKRK